MAGENEIEGLIARLERYQKSQNYTDGQFCDQFKDNVGSTKTWRDRLCAWRAGDPVEREAIIKDGFKLANWTPRIQALVSRLDGKTVQMERFFWEMPFSSMVGQLITQLRQQETDRRNLYVLATTGVGKSVTAMAIKEQRPNDTVYCRMHQGCRNRETAILMRLCQAMGMNDDQMPRRNLMEALTKMLQQRRTLFIIDEAHEMGTVGMKIVKALIDETRSCFAQFCYPTEYDRMRTATAGALDEAKQIFGRTMKPVFDDYRSGLRKPDVEIYLRRSGLTDEEAKDVAPTILGQVRAHGNLRVLDDAVRDATAVAEALSLRVDGGMIVKAVQAQCPPPRKEQL